MGVGRLGPGPVGFSLGYFECSSAFFRFFLFTFTSIRGFTLAFHVQKHFADDVVIAFSRLGELREIELIYYVSLDSLCAVFK